MRGNMLTVSAGAVAAFFYVALFLPVGIGSVLWPFTAIPLYLVALSRPASDNLLALAGAGFFITFLGVLGVLAPGGGQLLIGFLLTMALPAVVAGLYYRTLAEADSAPKGELLIAIYVMLSLGVFFITAAGFALAGTALHTMFLETAMPIAQALMEHLQTMDIPQEGVTAEAIARDISRQMAAFVPLFFILLHSASLLIARWLLGRRQIPTPPAPKLVPLRFSIKISFLFFGALSVYTYLLKTSPENTLIFYLSPLLAALAFPLAAQGLAFVYGKLIKRLVKGLRYGVYIVLLFTFLLAPIFTSFIFVMVGMANQLFANNEIKTK